MHPPTDVASTPRSIHMIVWMVGASSPKFLDGCTWRHTHLAWWWELPTTPEPHRSPAPVHDDHMVNSVQLPQNCAGPVESTNMGRTCIEIGFQTDVTASILDSWSTQPSLKTSSVVTYTPLHSVPFENNSCSCLNDSWSFSFSLMSVPISSL